jgi:hydroxyethylthiazole kinase
MPAKGAEHRVAGRREPPGSPVAGGEEMRMNTAKISNHEVWAAFDDVRQRQPLVHNLTNYVAMDLSANVLLAAGASPAMVHAREEAAEFADLASAVVINIGTLSPHWVASMHDAARVARNRGIPWVLDPVAAGATAYRTETAAELVELEPTVIRSNASELLALAGSTGRGRGVDSTDETADAVDAAAEIAARTHGVVAVTGAVDVVTDGHRTIRIAGGDPLMAKVTAMGCAASALVGAFTAVQDDPFVATVAALAIFGLAGERAASSSAGPGSLRWRLLDELHAIDGDDVRSGVQLT